MSRLFDGVDDQVKWAIGGCNLTGAWTFAQVLKFDAGVSWQGLLGNDIVASGAEVSCGRHTDGRYWVIYGAGAGASPVSTFTISSADGWMLLASRRPAGAGQAVTHTKYPIGGSPTHQVATGTAGNALSQDGNVVFGAIDGADFFKGRMVVCAEWNTVLTDPQVESLVTTFTRANWVSLSPRGLWDELDVFQTDYGVGTATRTSITGTADDADDPAGWATWAGSAPGAVMVGAPAGMFGRELVDKAGW